MEVGDWKWADKYPRFDEEFLPSPNKLNVATETRFLKVICALCFELNESSDR